ncbi:hypothetical protein ABB37_09161 [Leptomonas pyrrhocoris]|uniref:Uncharacterized protein n=1 Tax=Leptomonas pyrrhocoris TaxID=157538 RepID=A0A0N0DRI6_LEPPY|nr:hypothetical protein ABB37_09161 [Leptomonas pyrrhocoris]KPA74498.1 hypothetical protein ABB37_09161 [Leptomonas pyrrhocoris]|eukprot:XP_015652937.1 hypothetical protein ABB37_09161 [Leptomonas pyrrhocoris]
MTIRDRSAGHREGRRGCRLIGLVGCILLLLHGVQAHPGKLETVSPHQLALSLAREVSISGEVPPSSWSPSPRVVWVAGAQPADQSTSSSSSSSLQSTPGSNETTPTPLPTTSSSSTTTNTTTTTTSAAPNPPSSSSASSDSAPSSTTPTEAPITSTSLPATTTTTTTSAPPSPSPTSSSSSASSTRPPGAIIGAVVGSVVGAVLIGVGLGLICTYCACCRRCGGGCRAPYRGDDDESGSGSSIPDDAWRAEASPEASLRSFGGGSKRSNPHRRATLSTATSPETPSPSETDSDEAGSEGSFEMCSMDIDTEGGGGDGDGAKARACQHRQRDEVVPNDAVAFPMTDVGLAVAEAGEACWANRSGGRHDDTNRAASWPAPRAGAWAEERGVSLYESTASALLDGAGGPSEGFVGHHPDDGENFSEGAYISYTDRSTLREATVEQLYGDDEEARLRAVNSIRYHQSQGMSEDESVLLHLYRSSATSDPAFGVFIEGKDDVDSN